MWAYREIAVGGANGEGVSPRLGTIVPVKHTQNIFFHGMRQNLLHRTSLLGCGVHSTPRLVPTSFTSWEVTTAPSIHSLRRTT